MNLKDLLVFIDLSSTCSTRLTTAIQLAQQQQANLTGLYTIPPHRASDFEQPYKLAEQAKLKFLKSKMNYCVLWRNFPIIKNALIATKL